MLMVQLLIEFYNMIMGINLIGLDYFDGNGVTHNKLRATPSAMCGIECTYMEL